MGIFGIICFLILLVSNVRACGAPSIHEFWLALQSNLFSAQSQKDRTHKVNVFWEGQVVPSVAPLLDDISIAGKIVPNAIANIRYLDTHDYALLRYGWTLILREERAVHMESNQSPRQLISLVYHSDEPCDAFNKGRTEGWAVSVTTDGVTYASSGMTVLPLGSLSLPVTIGELMKQFKFAEKLGLDEELELKVVNGREFTEYTYRPERPFALSADVPGHAVVTLLFDADPKDTAAAQTGSAKKGKSTAKTDVRSKRGPSAPDRPESTIVGEDPSAPLLVEFGLYFEAPKDKDPNELHKSGLEIMDKLRVNSAWVEESAMRRVNVVYGDVINDLLQGRETKGTLYSMLREINGSGRSFTVAEIAAAGIAIVVSLTLIMFLLARWLNSDIEAPSTATRKWTSSYNYSDDDSDIWKINQRSAGRGEVMKLEEVADRSGDLKMYDEFDDILDDDFDEPPRKPAASAPSSVSTSSSTPAAATTISSSTAAGAAAEQPSQVAADQQQKQPAATSAPLTQDSSSSASSTLGNDLTQASTQDTSQNDSQHNVPVADLI